MNATAAPRRPQQQPELPQLPRKHRIGSVIASVVVSTLLLSSVVVGLTSAPEGANQMAGRATPAARV
jgi:hypothetical protein